ncbi:ATP-binding protein [Streptomyces sp. NPDC047002]|uniref:ATP-binding protein n=1 Tax=Streptomyces sp. NPDC047002 TaxID=3155475 RepID=UPI00345408C7
MTEPFARTVSYAAGVCLPAIPEAASMAREFTRHTLTAWDLPAHRDDAELIVSELVANAVTHAARQAARADREVGVRLALRDAGLLVEVRDAAGGRPGVPDQSEDAESGRGLFLVEALSRSWGVRDGAGSPGKVVWAELPPAPRPLPTLPPLPSRPAGAGAPALLAAVRHRVDAAVLTRVLTGLVRLAAAD